MELNSEQHVRKDFYGTQCDSKKQGNNTNVGMYLPIINVTAHCKVVKFVIKTSFIL